MLIRVLLGSVFISAVLASMPMYSAEVLSLPQVEVQESNSAPEQGVESLNLDFDRQELDDQGAISLSDFLSQQGLVQIKANSNQQNRTGVSIRGFGNNASANSLVLIDGLPLTSFTHQGPNLNNLILDSIATVQILPGSYGSRFGDQAVGGVLDIKTEIPATNYEKFSLNVGNRHQQLMELYLSKRLNGFAYSVGGQAYNDDHYQLNNRQNDRNFNAKVVYATDNNVLDVNVLALKTQIELPQALTVGGGRAVSQPDDNHSALNGVTVYLTNERQFNSDWSLNTGLANQRMDSHGLVNQFDFTSHQRSWVLQNTLAFREWLHGGINWEQQYYDLRNQVQNNRVSAHVLEGFVRATWLVFNEVELTAGVRQARQSLAAELTSGQHLNAPSSVTVDEQGVSWRFGSNWQWYARRDSNYRFAKANEKIWVSSNVYGLHTQTGVSYETGIGYLAGETQLSLGVYRLDLDNEIAYDPESSLDAPFGKMTNLAPTRRLGIDAIAQRALSPSWKLLLQMSLVEPTFRSGRYQSKQIPGVSTQVASVNTRYQAKGYLINLNQSYHAGYYAAYDLANVGGKMPAYWLSDVYWEKTMGSVSMGVQINNLFDRHFMRYATYRGGAAPSIAYYLSDGISILAKLSAKVL